MDRLIFRKYGSGVSSPNSGKECEVFAIDKMSEANTGLWQCRISFYETIKDAVAGGEGEVVKIVSRLVQDGDALLYIVLNEPIISGVDLSNAQAL